MHTWSGPWLLCLKYYILCSYSNSIIKTQDEGNIGAERELQSSLGKFDIWIYTSSVFDRTSILLISCAWTFFLWVGNYYYRIVRINHRSSETSLFFVTWLNNEPCGWALWYYVRFFTVTYFTDDGTVGLQYWFLNFN